MEYRRGGDIVIAVNGIPVQRFEDLVSFLVIQATPGDTITLTVLRDGETLEIPVVVGERPSGSGLPTAQSPDADGVNAREAIGLAMRAAEKEGLLTAEVTEKVATPDEINGVKVWVVELVTDNETVVVTIDAASGDVVDLSLR
jgi:2-alkenal reductase